MKIGYTNNIQTRLQQYHTNNPNYQLLCISEGTLDSENFWHKKYKCVKGEWGLYDVDVVNEFINEAYLEDHYFEESHKILAQTDDPGLCFLRLYESKTDEEKLVFRKMMKYNKLSKSLSVSENTLVWNPTEHTSLSIFIHKLIEKIPYKPKKHSEIVSEKPESIETTLLGLNWIRDIIDFYKEYSYKELETLFSPLFKEHNLVWNKNNSIKLYFPKYESRRKTKNGKKETYYKFMKF